jgi:hypothetical protein
MIPEQAPQPFYPQQPIIVQSSVQAKVPDPVVAGPEEVKQLIPEDDSIGRMTPVILESHNIIKDMIIEERLKMMEMLRNIKEDIKIQQRSIEANSQNIQGGQANIQGTINRMSDMLNDNFNDVQRSLEVQKGLIREHIAAANAMQVQQQQQPSMQSQFDSLEQRLAINMRQAFNPVLNQLEAESRAMRDREQQLWIQNFNQLKDDISELNVNQFKLMHDELKNHYAVWSNEIQADFKHSVDLDRQEWQRRMAMLADAFQGETVQQFIELRHTIVKAVTNIHYQFNRIEVNVFDDRFRQLEELLQRMYAERSRQDAAQGALPAPQSQAAVTGPPPQASLTGPPPQASLTGPPPQDALPAPRQDTAQKALPASQSQPSLTGPPPQAALPAPQNQAALPEAKDQTALGSSNAPVPLPAPIPAPASAPAPDPALQQQQIQPQDAIAAATAVNIPDQSLQAQSLQARDAAAAASAILMPSDTSDDDDVRGEKSKPGTSGVKNVAALQKRVEHMLSSTKDEVKRQRGAKEVASRSRDQIKTRRAAAREKMSNKTRDLSQDLSRQGRRDRREMLRDLSLQGRRQRKTSE